MPNFNDSAFEHKDTTVPYGTHDHPGLHADVLPGRTHMLPPGEPATKVEGLTNRATANALGDAHLLDAGARLDDREESTESMSSSMLS